MTREQRVNYSIFAFIAGAIARLTDLLDPIHELCHYAAANSVGIEVLEMHWSSLTYAAIHPTVIYGGYMGEFLLYGTLVFFFSLSTRLAYGKVFPGHKVKASFSLGILLVSWFNSFISLDFNVHALKYWESQAHVERNLIIWGVFSSIVLIFLLVIYFKNWGNPSKEKV